VAAMDIINLLDNKAIKSIEKREAIAEAIKMKLVTIREIKQLKYVLDDKRMAIILESMEAVTNKYPDIADLEWLKLTQDFIISTSNNIKRESSRIVGNIAHLFPNDLETAIEYIMENVKSDGTVIRWGSAYALARIIQIPQYANSDFYDALNDLFKQEQESGVKNQLLKGLKKAKRIRQ
jgi:hypothetical protein